MLSQCSTPAFGQARHAYPLPLHSRHSTCLLNRLLNQQQLHEKHTVLCKASRLCPSSSNRSSNSSRRSRTLAVRAAAPAEAASTAAQRDGSCLQNLMLWLVNNGVTGIGEEDSKVALYEDAEGDRGIIAAEDIPAGSQLVRVPLRLAITDVMEEQEKQQLVGQGALWQDRLVAKLLQQVQAGRESPWYPYLQALPKAVPSALESFSTADAEAVQLPAASAAIRGHADKMEASWQSCRPDSIGGADLQTYRWAHSVIMSRTFGNAAQGGGIGVRMLVPLIDMLNHAGDETGGLLSDPAAAKDNVRWDVVSPDNSPASCWEMVLSAMQAIPKDVPLLLSYFEGGNDEFMLHYGFVPPSNPHDTVQLFSSVTEALEHLRQQDMTQGKSAEQLAPQYKQALDAGLAALQAELAAASDGLADASWGPLLDALEPIKVASGSRISGSLIAALEVLKQGDMAAVEAAVAGLAWQQLAGLGSSLLADLALLVADGHAAGDGEAVQLYGKLLRHYAQAVIPEYAPELHDRIRAAAGSTSSSNCSSSGSGSVSLQPKRKKKAVPGPAQRAAAAAAAEQPAAGAAAAAAQQDDIGTAIEQLSLGAVVQALLPSSHSGTSSDTSSVTSDSVSLPMSAAVRTAVKFRVSKKMLLMDVCVAAGVPLAVLQQFQVAAHVEASTCHALPWQEAGSAGSSA